MPQYVPPSIEDIGLKYHLDTTANKHLGQTYDDFVRALNDRVVSKMAKQFGVNRKTIDKWIYIYNKEQNK